MTKLKQNWITIGGGLILSLIFIQLFTDLYIKVFGKGVGGGLFVIGPDIPQGIDGFFYAFPFFLTLLEFFFKKPLLQRRPYLYIIGFFVFTSFVDTVFLLATLAVILIAALPGTIYNWVRHKNNLD